jgi:hypothetical protein
MKAILACARAIELRKASRYRLSAPALFLWAPQDGPPQTGEGITRDISTSGVYVLAESSPPVGARVQLDILLPKLADASPGMHLHGEGVVLRVEPGGAKGAVATEGGFAAAVQFYPEASELALSHGPKNSGRVV